MAFLRQRLGDGESVAVIGGRRSGKTWLVRRIRADDVGRPVFFTSGDELTFASEAPALRQLAGTLGLALSRDLDEYDARAAIRARLDAIGPCVLVIDETDRILGQPWAGGFLAWLRSLIDTAGLGRTIAIVAVGGPVLDHYRNPRDRGSPVLNLAERLFLDPLDRGSLDELVVDRADPPTAVQVLEAAGGQPAAAHAFLRAWAARADAAADDVAHEMLAALRSQLTVWREQLGPEGERFLRTLPPQGVRVADVRHDEGCLRARYLCLVRIEGGRILPGPELVIRHVLGAERPRYDVAISYAGEDSRIARAVYDGLVSRRMAVFFAEAETDWLVGMDLYKVLPNLYAQGAATVLVICTATYLAKHWTLVEYNAARSALGDRIVLLSLDDALPADWPAGHLYRKGTPENLVGLVDLIERRAHRQGPTGSSR